MEMTCQKHLFSLEEGIHYFNNASKGPLLKSSEAAVLKALHHNRNPYDFSPPHYFTKVDNVKKSFAQLIHCRPTQVAIIPSVSYGMASAINNIPYQKGQHALLIDEAFPSDFFAVKRWCDQYEAPLKIISPDPKLSKIGANWNERILEQINESTAFIVLSNVHWMNTVKFDLAAIGAKCKATNTRLLVDGTQSVGALPTNVQELGIDALICGSYKWLFGPYGLGLAYYSEFFNDGVPLEEAWMNRTNALEFSQLTNYGLAYKPDANRYSVGEASNFLQMPMLEASLKQVLEWQAENIQAYTSELLQIILDFMDENGLVYEDKKYRANHLFSLNLPNANLESIRQALAENKIYLSVRGSSLRVAMHLYNTKEDVHQLVQILQKNL